MTAEPTCQCHHPMSKHVNDYGACTGEYYGPCHCKGFRPLEEGHFRGDGCREYHGKEPERIPLSVIRAKFQASLELQDFGDVFDYGGMRWHSKEYDSQRWLEKNAEAILFSLLFPKEEEVGNSPNN